MGTTWKASFPRKVRPGCQISTRTHVCQLVTRRFSLRSMHEELRGRGAFRNRNNEEAVSTSFGHRQGVTKFSHRAQTLQLEEPQGRAFFADLERRKVKDAAKHFALVGKCLSECLLRTHKEEGIFLEPPPENNHADKCSATSRPRKKHKPWHTSSHVFSIDQTLTRAATRVNGEAVWSITDQNARHAPQGSGDEQQMGSSHPPETPMGRAGGTQQSQSPNHSSGTKQMGRNTNDLNDTSMNDSIIWQNHPPAQHIQVLSVRESLVPVRSSRSECSTPIVETSTSPLNMTSPAQSSDATLEAPLAMHEREVAALRACRLSPSTLEGNNNGGHSGRMVPRGSGTAETARFQMASSSRSSYKKSPYPHAHEPCLGTSERLERSPTTRPASDSMMIGSQTTETPMSQSISTSLHPANDAQSFTPSHCMSQEVIAAGPRLSTTGFSPSTRSLETWPQNVEPQSRGLSHEATESPRSLDERQDNIPNRPSLRQSNAMAIRNLLGESSNLPSHNFISAPEVSEMQDSLPELESDTPRWEPSLPKFLESDIGDTATPRNRLESDAENQPEDAVAESQPTHVRPFHQRQHSSSIIQSEHDHPTDSPWGGHFSLASVCPPTGDATFPGEGNFPKVVGSERSNEMEDAHLVETGIRTDVHNPPAEAVGNIPEANSGGGDRPQESPRVLDDPRYEALFDTNDLFPDWDEPLDPDYIVPESV